MKCPSCGSTETKVIDSRLSRDGNAIRRRRECEKCGRRFTTYERLEEVFPLLVKKDGRREPYDRNKVLIGIQKALEKEVGSLRDDLKELVARELAAARDTEAKDVLGLSAVKKENLDEALEIFSVELLKEFVGTLAGDEFPRSPLQPLVATDVAK